MWVGCVYLRKTLDPDLCLSPRTEDGAQRLEGCLLLRGLPGCAQAGVCQGGGGHGASGILEIEQNPACWREWGGGWMAVSQHRASPILNEVTDCDMW